MAERQINTPGILTLDTLTEITSFNIALSIPAQTLILRSYRAEYASAAASLARGVVYVDLPFLNGNQILDGNVGHVFLPLILDDAAVTVRDGLSLPIHTSTTIPNNFEMVIRTGPDAGVPANSFIPDPTIVRLTMCFELAKGHLA